MKPIYKGNVHEIYDVSEKQIAIVTTDRITVHGKLLPIEIKKKGIVLNKMSNFWFERTKDIIQNHILENNVDNMPSFFKNNLYRDRTILVKKLKILPFEFIVRGYIFGRMWRAKENHEKFYGIDIDEKYKLGQKLVRPIITPTIKSGRKHDQNIEIKDVELMLGTGRLKKITEICFELYKRCYDYAFSKGLIIADTKFEFGLDENDELVLADEIFTPDSSRYWDAKSYKVGETPKSYDKQILRDWMLKNENVYNIQKEIPIDIIEKTEKRYSECLQKIVYV